jgi:acyl dehydratase
MRYFEDLSVGDEKTFEEEYHVSEQEIIEMGRRWDPQPFHIDPVAAKASMFGGLVASSAHIFCIFVSMGNQEIDRDKNVAAASALGFDKLRWHAPVRPGDVLRIEDRVIAVRESKSRPELGICTIANRLFNQRGETVFTLESTFLAKKRS